MEEQLTVSSLMQYQGIIALPILEVIRYCKLHLNEVRTGGVKTWPEGLYRLIDREDVINNIDSIHNAETKQARKGGLQKLGSMKYTLARGMQRGFSTVYAPEPAEDNLHVDEALNNLIGSSSTSVQRKKESQQP